MALFDVYRVKYFCFDDEAKQLSVAVTHYVVTSLTGAAVTDQELADSMSQNVAAHWKALMTVTTAYYGLSLQRIAPTSGGVTTSSVGRGAGTIGGNQMPNMSSSIIQWLSGSPGRPFRGRTYVGFLTSSFLTVGGHLSAAGITAVRLLAADMIGPNVNFNTALDGTVTTSLGIWHRDFGNVTDAVTFVVGPKLGTQKRRGDYGRLNPAPF